MRGRSTIDISSTTRASPRSGFRSSRLKAPFFGWNSRTRWIVRASRPVVSARRFAARPVGAARMTSRPHFSKMSTTARMIVVLPVPGPPVMTRIFFSNDWRMARFWSSEKARPRSFSVAATAASRSKSGGRQGKPASRWMARATSSWAW